MLTNSWTLYLLAFASSAVLALYLTPLALKVAVSRGIFDQPGSYKKQQNPVPYLGGAAIALAFSLALLGGAVLAANTRGFRELALIIGVALLLCLVGLYDDIAGLGPVKRVIVETACATGIWFAGIRIVVVGGDIPSFLITVAWIVGITNAFNLLDNMDGLSAGVAVIAASYFFYVAAKNGQFLVASLSAGLAGCAIGFLRHNVHPARIYMGDAGSLFIGFLLAVIGVKLQFPGPTQASFLVPILVLAVPLFDTTLVFISRLLHKRNPWLGARDHTSHRLVLLGIPVRTAVGLIYGAAVATGIVAIIVSRIDLTSSLLLFFLEGAIALFLGALMSFLPVYEDSSRRRRMEIKVVKHEEPIPPHLKVPENDRDPSPSTRT